MSRKRSFLLLLLLSLLPFTQSYAEHSDGFPSEPALFSERISSIDDYPYLQTYDWFKDPSSTHNFKQAIRFISLAGQYGLEPDDYHLNQLESFNSFTTIYHLNVERLAK